jgi:hypothetical protein
LEGAVEGDPGAAIGFTDAEWVEGFDVFQPNQGADDAILNASPKLGSTEDVGVVIPMDLSQGIAVEVVEVEDEFGGRLGNDGPATFFKPNHIVCFHAIEGGERATLESTFDAFLAGDDLFQVLGAQDGEVVRARGGRSPRDGR